MAGRSVRVVIDANLALAEHERVDLWTADRQLANGARQIGLQWVHGIDPGVSGFL
jgi:hypothetical protein